MTTKKELQKALQQKGLYTFIADNYDNLTKYELKEVMLALIAELNDCCEDRVDEVFDKVEEDLNEIDFFEE